MRIVLLGYMGSGKSSLGKKLANKLNYPFVDLDVFIEKEHGCSVTDLFEREGEVFFRSEESRFLRQILSEQEDMVLSVGGGTPCFNDNMDFINQNSHSVFIDLPVTTLAQRLEQGKSSRPLIADKSKEELQQFIQTHLTERLPFYEQANTRFAPLKETIDILIRTLKL